MPEKDPAEVVDEILSSGRNIRLGRGVVSKTSYVAGIVALVWGAIVLRWSGNLIADSGLIIVGLIATAFAVWFIHRTQRFAEQNPAQALLEGAELLEWQKTEIQAKGLPPVPGSPTIPGKGTALIIDAQPGDKR